MEVKKLVTYRHMQVSAYMTQERPNIKHTYDVWHLAKVDAHIPVHKYFQ